MTNKLTKGALAAIALLATPLAAAAADIRVPHYKAPQRSVVAYYNWSGLYLGGTVGYGMGTSTWDLYSLNVSPRGMMYGITAGYNWQSGSFVYGIEGDYNFSQMKGSGTCAVAFTCETSNTWLATFRGRFGYAFDRFMPYVTAGGAYGNIKGTINTVPMLDASSSKFGWTVGAGIEYAFLSNWTAKLEYLYVNLGSFETGFSTPVANTVSLNANIVRAGLNYKFGGPISSRW